MGKLWNIVFSAIVVILIFNARSNSVLDSIIPEGVLGFGLPAVKDSILIIGITVQVLCLSWPLYKSQTKLDTLAQQMESVLEYYKGALETALARVVNKRSVRINVRVFIPLKPWYYEIGKLLAPLFKKAPPKRAFYIRNIDGLAVRGRTKDLIFDVEPECQGVVGRSYSTNKLAWDDDLRSDLSRTRTRYNMSQEQINKTCDISFCCCVPIFNKNKFVAIVAYDSTDDIKLSSLSASKVSEVEQFFTLHSETLYQYFPEIFDYEKEGF